MGFHRRAAAVHHELGDAWEHALELDYFGITLRPEDSAGAYGHWTQALGLLAPYTDPRALAVRARVEARLAEVA